MLLICHICNAFKLTYVLFTVNLLTLICFLNKPGILHVFYTELVGSMHYSILRATYLAGELLCSIKDMIQFTAVLCQICKGDMEDK